MIKYFGNILLIICSLYFSQVLAGDKSTHEQKKLPTAGYYSGSFDPPTLGHNTLILNSIDQLSLKKIYISVNTTTSKNYNSSVAERMELLKQMFSNYQGKAEVIVVSEPYEGRVWFTKKLIKKSKGNLYTIFGEDVYKKNHKLLSEVKGVQFAIFPREMDKELEENVKSKTKVLTINENNQTSSSYSRSVFEKGEMPSNLVPQVQDYIKENALYTGLSNEQYQEKLKAFAAKKELFLKRIRALYLNIPDFSDDVLVGLLQSRHGEDDRLIRFIVEEKKFSPSQAREFGRVARKILGSTEFDIHHYLSGEKINSAYPKVEIKYINPKNNYEFKNCNKTVLMRMLTNSHQ